MEFDYPGDLEEDATSTSRSTSPGGPPEDGGAFEPSGAAQLEAYEAAGARRAGGGFGGSSGAAAAAAGAPLGGGAAASGSPGGAAGAAGGDAQLYDPAEFEHLNVTEDVRDLFKHIGRYRPSSEPPPPPLKPFIPEYIPALGEPDAFIKVPRPDGVPDWLGLKVLDEPAAVQSDAAVLALQLRQLGGAPAAAAPLVVGTVDAGADASRRAKAIDAWMASVADIHRKRPAASVAYGTPLPSVDALMQELPPDVEAVLREARLPGGDVDLELVPFARLVCALLDAPVHDAGGGAASRALLESLHLLFALLLAFRENPFFRQALGDGAAAAGGAREAGGGPAGGGGGGVGGQAADGAVGVAAAALAQWTR
ncbi:hypothetical protein Rsub_08639 [Raphidocelis subcapitata]|uniref:Intraflagellar transport protein 46 homolog n=1 Tax=Raphidocelis subcapitata TaxID=307507 RepID=A0A2V0PEQ2_9CHLO|nr:hypothetical protein Rsub_08639 [Raphidocelis subcapitata]|eukprot:GBF95657.1 hypothetical protein Rsub_08639 [Raphidocelis subcapitata]